MELWKHNIEGNGISDEEKEEVRELVECAFFEFERKKYPVMMIPIKCWSYSHSRGQEQ